MKIDILTDLNICHICVYMHLKRMSHFQQICVPSVTLNITYNILGVTYYVYLTTMLKETHPFEECNYSF